MTEQQARDEISDIDSFCQLCCDRCIGNEWYCPSECKVLQKARELDYERIIKCYIRHDGDLVKVCNYLRETKRKDKSSQVNEETMSGYYFVITEYESGRIAYSAKRYQTKQGAERRAAINRLKIGVKSARVCYEAGQPVDIKKFI